MFKETSELLNKIIEMMYIDQNETLVFSDSERELSIKANFKNGAMMNFEFQATKEKSINFKTEDFQIAGYHSSIARLMPIYHQLSYFEKNLYQPNSELILSLAAVVSNVSMMLDEQSLIKTENLITDYIPKQLQNELIIVCGPIGEYIVCTVHFVKLVGRSNKENRENPTYFRQFLPNTVFSHLGNDYCIQDSVSMKLKSKTQSLIMNSLKALKMQLISISTNLSIEEDEENDN